MKTQPLLFPAAPCTTHSAPGACCPSAQLILAPPKTREKAVSHFYSNPYLQQGTLQSMYISQCSHCKEAWEWAQEEQQTITVAVPSHAHLQFHTCRTMATWLWFCGRGCCTCGKHSASWATGHLYPCLAPTGFQQPL